ncbi:MAG: hypothetical protein OXC95_17400 [Dehalococcoidia bacterium]|nr:hypothetical protein [Dehalococcoidia bacterium]
MTTDTDNLTPQERLVRIVREETDGGRKIVRFSRQVVEGELQHEGFQPNHRMDSAKELVKIGLTEFQDYIDANTAPPKRRKTRRPSTDINEISPEVLQAREDLAKYARELTQDGRTAVTRFAEIMDGLRNDEGFHPHHRIAAGRELLLQDILDIVDGDDPLDDCPCALAEAEGRDIPCPENEECPYYGIEFPKFSEEDQERNKEQALRGLRMHAELMGLGDPSEHHP